MLPKWELSIFILHLAICIWSLGTLIIAQDTEKSHVLEEMYTVWFSLSFTYLQIMMSYFCSDNLLGIAEK